MGNRRFSEALLMLFAANFLNALSASMQREGTLGTLRTRSPNPMYQTPIYWVDEHHISVNVKLGHGNQSFKLLVDTSADATWVVHSSATAQAWQSRRKFISHHSPTFKQGHQVFFNAFQGSHTIEGYTVTDNLQIGDLQLTDFPFKLGMCVPDSLVLPPDVDGVFGLTPGVFSFGTDSTLLKALKRKHPDVPNRFGIKLCNETGLLTIGDLAQEAFQAATDYVQLITDNALLGVVIKGIYVQHHIFIRNPSNGYIVTSYGYIQGPAALVEQVNRRLGFAKNINGTFYFGGTQIRVLHNVKFAISQYAFDLPKENYVKTDGMGNRYTIIRQHDEDFWILGLAAIRGYYFAYNGDPHAITVGRAKCP